MKALRVLHVLPGLGAAGCETFVRNLCIGLHGVGVRFCRHVMRFCAVSMAAWWKSERAAKQNAEQMNDKPLAHKCFRRETNKSQL